MLKKIAGAPEGDCAVIHCDICNRVAPPPKEVFAAHGLNRLGWHCTGGSHICPDHEHPPILDGSAAFTAPVSAHAPQTDFPTAMDAINYAVDCCPDEAAKFLREWRDGPGRPVYALWLSQERRRA